jgi:hypothetical protein
MPGCVLRATGKRFQAKMFLEESTLQPCNVFSKGERKSNSRVWETSGFTAIVSEASGSDFMTQVSDAIRFINAHKDELLRLREFEGIEKFELDFGVYTQAEFLQSFCFPAKLISSISDLQLDIELSVYGEIVKV